MGAGGGIKHYFASWGIWVRLVARQHPVPSDFAGRRPARLRGQQAEHTARNIRTACPFPHSTGVDRQTRRRDKNPCDCCCTRLRRTVAGSSDLPWNVGGAVAGGQPRARRQWQARNRAFFSVVVILEHRRAPSRLTFVTIESYHIKSALSNCNSHISGKTLISGETLWGLWGRWD